MEFLKQLFADGDFLPHGTCYLWNSHLMLLHVISDGLIALAYMSIPITLVAFARKRKDVPFNWMFLCFGMFIVACGMTHIMEIVVLWHPIYWLSGVVKVITAGASVPTAILLVRLIPQALKLPSPAQLHEKNLELERANLAKDRFLATMSHELRTPLNAILGFTGTLLMKLPGPLTADQEKQLRTVENSGRHLLSLINDLLDLAKIESGKVELRLEPVSCQNVVREVAAALRPLAEGKGLQFKVNAPATDLMVETDKRALSQILINLANNAIKFTETGEVRLELNQCQDDGYRLIQFSVVDTGIGIRREDQSRLFQAFTNVKGARSRVEGTGLGLHLSQKLAGMLGGQITMNSEYGKGSRFTLVLSRSTSIPAATSS